jgi:uncharacterized phage protein (TIGR02218 family)
MSVDPQGLAQHFACEVTSLCHCWRLTTRAGEVSGYTDHDRPLLVDGTLFDPQTGFSASEARRSLGLAVDTLDVEGALSSRKISAEDIAAGRYDGASVETLLVNWRAPQEFAVVRILTVGKITRADGHFVAELESMAHRLDQQNGRYVTRRCDAELGDTRCRAQLGQPAFHGSGAADAVQGPDTWRVSGLDGFEPGWFSFGTLTWSAGARVGRTERIVDHRVTAQGVLLTLQPAIGPEIAAGDAFAIVAGCDKTFAACKAKFANSLNFRGFPHLPGNDVAYAYVSDGGNFDGGPVVP